MVVQLDQLGNGRVEPQRIHVVAHSTDRAMQESLRFGICGAIEQGYFARLFVDHISPQSLQEPVHADDVACLPWSRRVERTHRHLIEPQRVSAVALADVVGGDGVLEALAHLAPLAGDRQVAVEIRSVALDDLCGIDVDLAFVLERCGQDVALVEQTVVGLLRRHVTEVEQHLVPEPRVHEVQDGVFDATYVEIDPARMRVAIVALGLRAHPVPLDLSIDEPCFVGRVEISQLVPATARPLRHDVGVAPVGLRAVAQVELDIGPPVEPIERALRVGELVVRVEGAWREAVGLG